MSKFPSVAKRVPLTLLPKMIVLMLLMIAACSSNEDTTTPPPSQTEQALVKKVDRLETEVATLHHQEGKTLPAEKPPPAGTHNLPADQEQDGLVTISTGSNHACGITASERVNCWGENSQGQAEAPPGRFTDISAGSGHTCALATNGTVTCWGTYGKTEAKAPKGTFRNIAPFGGNEHCGVTTENTIDCWPDKKLADLWPAGEYDLVEGTCAVPKSSDTICIGRDRTYQRKGRYSSLSAYQEVCGIDADQKGQCWSRESEKEILKLPGKYQSLSIGEERVVCGIRTDGTANCTQIGGKEITPPELRTRKAKAVALNYTETAGCAIMASGQPFCWDWNENQGNPQTWPIWGTKAE